MTFSSATSVRVEFGSVGRTLAAGVASALLGFLQVALGGDALTSALFTLATFFGLLSVLQAGIDTAVGLLNLLLVGRFLLGSYAIKNVIQVEPISDGLLEPEHTGAVFVLGFAGVWLATLVVRRFARRIPLFEISNTTAGLRALTIILLIGGTFSLVAIRLASATGEATATTGGAWGLAKEFASFRVAALPTLLLYLWRSNSRRWLTHPLVLALTLFLFLQGMLGSSKQGMADPIALYCLMALARYGWRHPFIWIGIPVLVLMYQYFIHPIGQYARNEGGRDIDPRQAAIATADIVAGYLTDSAFRDRVLRVDDNVLVQQQGNYFYLQGKQLAFSRIAMVGEADRLVAATDRFGYTGFETIGHSLLLMIPHFLYPNKPQAAAGNYLAHVVGDVPEDDYSTQVSYGFMANAYNAYGLVWVLPLSFVSALLVLGLSSLSASGRFFADPWSILAIAALHQAYVEASFSGQLGAIHQPVDAFFLLGMTMVMLWLLRNVLPQSLRGAVAQP